jgi:hypothetical protein|tara:strand:- start:80 stop:277 length:198 start_codon:yes stop_codon:yes gene_type:complete
MNERKRYFVKHCHNGIGNFYQAHYDDGTGKNAGQLFSCKDYGSFLQFTSLLKESGYKYIENEEEY